MTQTCEWGDVPTEAKARIVACVQEGWNEAGDDWAQLQKNIANKFVYCFGPENVKDNVRLSQLGVPNSQAEIDIAISAALADTPLCRLLVQVSGGGRYPRHEKELLEFLAVSAVSNPGGWEIGVLVVSSVNRLTLEGKRNSWGYCSKALLNLAKPILQGSHLTGLVIIGLP